MRFASGPVTRSIRFVLPKGRESTEWMEAIEANVPLQLLSQLSSFELRIFILTPAPQADRLRRHASLANCEKKHVFYRNIGF